MYGRWQAKCHTSLKGVAAFRLRKLRMGDTCQVPCFAEKGYGRKWAKGQTLHNPMFGRIKFVWAMAEIRSGTV